MSFPRESGVLLHPTSLPGRFGIGDLGQAAYDFIDFLEETGQSLWQVLPLGPTGYGDSPYQCFSAFAGNPLLINLDAAGEGRDPALDGGAAQRRRLELRSGGRGAGGPGRSDRCGACDGREDKPSGSRVGSWRVNVRVASHAYNVSTAVGRA